MPASDRHQQPLRLPRDVAARLRRQAERRKIALNTYVQLAVEEKLDADEARQQQRDGDRRERRDRDGDAPRGLGLRSQRMAAPEPPLELPADPVAPVVVQVGVPQAAAGAGDLIAGLAAYVIGGAMFERERRTRQAKDILRAYAQTPEERERLEALLEGALREQKKQAGRPSFSSIGSLFPR